MPFRLYKQVARELFPSACKVFFCSGGEPFLYPKIREALQLARRYRTLATVSTNGMLLDRQTADWIIEDQTLHELCISFDAARRNTLERIRRGANYAAILENVQYVAALKQKRRLPYPRLSIRYVIMSSNAEELPELFELCHRHGVYKVVVKYVNIANDIDPAESLFNRPELASRVFAKADSEAERFGIQLKLPPPVRRGRGSRRCLAPWQFCQIDTDGAVRPCYFAWQQRLAFFADGFPSIWQGEDYMKIRSTVDSAVPYFPYCRYCSAHRGFSFMGSHSRKLHQESYVIPGLEKWQVPFNLRAEENVASAREHHLGRDDEL